MFGKVSRAKDYACIEVEGSRDLLSVSVCVICVVWKHYNSRQEQGRISIVCMCPHTLSNEVYFEKLCVKLCEFHISVCVCVCVCVSGGVPLAP